MKRTREFFVVIVPESRREYVCVPQEERGDLIWYDMELMSRGYDLDWGMDTALVAEMQAVMHEHEYRRIVAMRRLTAHDLIRSRSLPNPRPMTLTVDP